ncbi:FHA domain-containing protein [Balamuthia mandrillaris]
MELVEPLLMTVGSIRSLVKNNQDIGQEVVELGSTIGLIEGAIAPLRSFHSEADSHLTQVLKALQDCLNSAKTALERVAEKSKKKFLFFFRSGIELDELRSYQDKLKTLCPILSLAITAQQQHFRHQEHQQQMNSLKRRGNGDDARRRREGGEEEEEEEMEEEERKRRRKEQDDCDFDATNILKSEDAARFWRLHFGAKTYKVSWERFKAAFEHEYGPSVTKDEESLSILRDRLDKDHDGLIDVYEVASFVATGGRGKEAGSNSNNGGNNSSLLQCFKTAVLQHRKQKLVAPTNSKSRNHLKTRSLSWGSISDSHTSRKPVPNVSSMSEQQPPLQHTVMGPPPASPQKRKFKLAPNTVTTSGGNSAASSSSLSSESNKTETKKRGAEEMRGDDTDDQTFGFMLLLFGKSSIMKLRACQDENVTKVKKTWDPQTPFVVGRIHFEKLPKELLLRISRAHFEIHCTENNVPASATPQKQYWIIDKSGNGTFLNGKRMQKNTKMRLHDGDMIGIITEKRKEEVEMGYLFKIIEPSSFNADPKQQSLSSSQKRLRRSANNEDDSENKESEEEQLPCTPPQQHKVPTIVVTPPASPSSSASPPSSASSSASTCSPLSSLSSHPTSDDLDSSASPPSVTTTASSSSPYRSPQRALSRSAPPMSPSRIPTSIPSRASPSPSSASRRRLHSTSPKTLRLEEEESESVDSTPILGRK